MEEAEVMQPPVNYAGRSFRERVRFDRPLTSYSKVQNAVGWLLRNRMRVPKQAPAYLNAGCGPNIRRGFVNLDYGWRPGLDLCWDLAKRLPFKDGTLKGIYTEHCLEHLAHEDCRNALREFHRVLVPGGVLRLVVPDAELYLRAYVAQRDRAEIDPDLGSVQMAEVNRTFRDHGHRYAYDYDAMSALLQGAGFRDVARSSFGEGRDRKLLIDTEARRYESLYIEAVR